MRVLFTSTPGSGHLGPLFPFAHALRRAGHEVLVAAPYSAQARVERAGLPYLSFADPLDADMAPHWERVRRVGPDEANDIVIGEVFVGVRAKAALPGIELAIDAWRPHVVVRESCEFAGAIAAEAREHPARARRGVPRLDRGLRDPHGGAGARGAARVGRARARPRGSQARRGSLPDADPAVVRAAGRDGRLAHACASTTRRRARTRSRIPASRRSST